MGQRLIIGFRVGVTRNWESIWFAEKKQYTKFLHEDLEIRKFLKEKASDAQISKIEIRRKGHHEGGEVEIEIHAAKPGIIYGRKSKGLDILRDELQSFIQAKPKLFIIQVRKADLEAQLVAENIAQQLVKRVSFRRAMKKAMQQAMRAGAIGIKVSCLVDWAVLTCLAVSGSVKVGTSAHTSCGCRLWYSKQKTRGITGVKVWLQKVDRDAEGKPLIY